jgi:hypothetical protein
MCNCTSEVRVFDARRSDGALRGQCLLKVRDQIFLVLDAD